MERISLRNVSPLVGSAVGVPLAIHHLALARGALMGSLAGNMRLNQAFLLFNQLEALLQQVDHSWDDISSINAPPTPLNFSTPISGTSQPHQIQNNSPCRNGRRLGNNTRTILTPSPNQDFSRRFNGVPDRLYAQSPNSIHSVNNTIASSEGVHGCLPCQNYANSCNPDTTMLLNYYYADNQFNQTQMSPPNNQVIDMGNISPTLGVSQAYQVVDPPSINESSVSQGANLTCPYCNHPLNAVINLTFEDTEQTGADIHLRIHFDAAEVGPDELRCPNCQRIVYVQVQLNADETNEHNHYGVHVNLLQGDPIGNNGHSSQQNC